MKRFIMPMFLCAALSAVTGCGLFGGSSSAGASSVNLTTLLTSATNSLAQLEAAYNEFQPQMAHIESLIQSLKTNDLVKAQSPAMPSVSVASPRVTRRAVICGLDRVDPKKWNGWAGECPGTLLDQSRKRAQLAALGYDKVIDLTNAEATVYGVTAAAIYAADGLKPNDLLYVFVSGHGGQNPDANGDESDGKDEFVCLYDGPLLDDTIWQLLCKVPAGVRVALEFDTCESRTMYRGVGTDKAVRAGKHPHDYAKSVRTRKQARAATDGDFKGRLLVVSGCDDGASSYGSDAGGNLTTCDAKAFSAHPAATYTQWFAELKRLMPRSQIPYMSEVGDSFANYPAMR